jgi:hypothetical protein
VLVVRRQFESTYLDNSCVQVRDMISDAGNGVPRGFDGTTVNSSIYSMKGLKVVIYLCANTVGNTV